MGSEFPLAKKPRLGLPENLPWRQSVGLLLDAIQVEKLLQRLFEWTVLPRVDVLYLQTRFAEFRDVSPCLVQIQGADDPILAQFLANIDQQWGYLLISDAPWEELVAHVRWLTSIEHPSGEEMLLRIAFPAVADALLGALSPDPVLFGPCQQVFTANSLHNSWHQYTRPDAIQKPKHDAPYRLSTAQWDSLTNATLYQTVTELYRHMATYFPDYRNDLTTQERWEHVHQLTIRAAELGFDSKKELWLYANAHGFLGEQTLLTNPTFVALLNPKVALLNPENAAPSAERIDDVANLASAGNLP